VFRTPFGHRRTTLGAALTAVAVAAIVPIAAAAAPATGGGRQGGGTDPAVRSTLQRIVDAGAPGALARVVDGPRSASSSAGVADRRTGAAIDPHARFRAGSQTKTFTATVVLQLVGEGRMRLSDTVEDWLPGLVPGGEKITVQHLLRMQSGLANYTDDPTVVDTRTAAGWRAGRFRSTTEYGLVKIALAMPRRFQPGDGFAYSNTNYTLAGLVVQAVTGKPIRQEVLDRIILPLNLKATSYPTDSAMVPSPRMNGYIAPSEERLERYLDSTLQDPTWAGAAGAIISTTADLSRFYQALLGGRLLRPAELTAMTTTVPTTGDATFQGLPIRYGLGLYSYETSCGLVWGHAGQIPGYQFFPFVSRDGRRQVLYAQNASPALGDPRAQLAGIISLPETVFCGAGSR
jgi:D-alanyl-D-alanine carboxypeptidase